MATPGQRQLPLLLFGLCTVIARADESPVKLIVDTDAGFDVDDVGAICIANALQDQGEAEILAVGHTNGFDKGIGAVSTLMQYYGRGSVPLGAYKGPWARDPSAGKGNPDKYISDLLDHFPSPVKSSQDVPEAVDVYRKVLAAQPNHSVHIASVGITTNMRDLVLSKPDRHSPLDGKALIEQKVKAIFWMAHIYNFGCANHDLKDWLGPDVDCRGSAKAALENWPSRVPQLFSPIGEDTLHGDWLSSCSPSSNPCRRAFEDFLGPHKGRSSWDPITILTAVRGPKRAFAKPVVGIERVSEAGVESWTNGGNHNQSRTGYAGPHSQQSLSDEINRLLCKPPGHTMLI